MGHFGFSYVGLIFVVMLIVPNLFWTKYPPKNYSPKAENRVLWLFEKVGQAACFSLVLIFSDFNLNGWSPWCLWLIAAFLLMLLYEGWWIRYFKSPRTLADFYRGYLHIPYAGATLPVAAFLLLGIYGKVIWLIIAAVILGIGHIGIHVQHGREQKSEQEKTTEERDV